MWPFKKQEPPAEVDLTNNSYTRWLLAHRPPFEWFLGQDEATQEMLADIGAAHSEDFCVAVSLAIQNPEAVDVGVNGTSDLGMEENLVKKVAMDLIQKSFPGRQAAPVAAKGPYEEPNLTMAGVFDRRKQAEQAREEESKKKHYEPNFLGRPPDGAEETVGESS